MRKRSLLLAIVLCVVLLLGGCMPSASLAGTLWEDPETGHRYCFDKTGLLFSNEDGFPIFGHTLDGYRSVYVSSDGSVGYDESQKAEFSRDGDTLQITVFVADMKQSSWELTLVTEDQQLAEETRKLVICASYAVPGMFCYDYPNADFACEILEKDDYGRILFSYTTHNVISGKEETAVVICQKIDDLNVCFYEDVCYLFGDPDKAAIKQLKEQNDWDAELADYKMADRDMGFDKTEIEVDTWVDMPKFKQAIAETFEITEEQIRETYFLDCDSRFPSANELYLVEYEKDGANNRHYVIVDRRYDLYTTPAGNSLPGAAELHQFKEDYWWTFAEDGPI